MGNDGGPAFPTQMFEHPAHSKLENSAEYGYGGMTLRDYFAAVALGAIVSQAAIVTSKATGGSATASEIANGAYELADAMLAERQKPTNKEQA
jgi:hypothetical protein